MDDAQLEKLTLQELRDLRNDVIAAIRAAIRAKNQAQPQPAFLAQSQSKPVAPAVLTVVDLERERDAWLSAKRQPQA